MLFGIQNQDGPLSKLAKFVFERVYGTTTTDRGVSV